MKATKTGKNIDGQELWKIETEGCVSDELSEAIKTKLTKASRDALRAMTIPKIVMENAKLGELEEQAMKLQEELTRIELIINTIKDEKKKESDKNKK